MQFDDFGDEFVGCFLMFDVLVGKGFDIFGEIGKCFGIELLCFIFQCVGWNNECDCIVCVYCCFDCGYRFCFVFMEIVENVNKVCIQFGVGLLKNVLIDNWYV